MLLLVKNKRHRFSFGALSIAFFPASRSRAPDTERVESTFRLSVQIVRYLQSIAVYSSGERLPFLFISIHYHEFVGGSYVAIESIQRTVPSHENGNVVTNGICVATCSEGTSAHSFFFGSIECNLPSIVEL